MERFFQISQRNLDAMSSGRIEIRGLTRRFGSLIAVHPFEAEMGPGGITGLLGPNGSGKTTLLRMLVGLVRPDAGRASVDGVELRGDGTAVRRRCSYCPGEIGYYGEMRGSEHLEWLLRGRDREARRRSRAFAEELGLPLRSRVHGYSHGMKRQLLLAAAMGPRLRVRLLDEPTEGLDPSRRSTVLSLLEEDAAGGTTVLLSSHHFGEVDRSCDRLVFLNEGRLLTDTSPEEIHARARRLLRLEWLDGGVPADAEERLARLGVESVQLQGARAVVELDRDDPRPFLSGLAADEVLPAPRALDFGRLSLQELYRDLYGEEGT